MKIIPPQLLADLKAECTTLAHIWLIEKRNGTFIRGTEHDQDIVMPPSASPDLYSGTYFAQANITVGDVQSNTDLSVDNAEVTGAFQDAQSDTSPPSVTTIDVTVDDVESGLLDQAPVTVLVVNWMAPTHGYYIEKKGTLGTISRDSDGKYTTEVRGLSQPLTQTIIRTYSPTCDVVTFGDARCKYNVAAATVSGHVTAATDDLQQFTVDITGDSPPTTSIQFVGGKLLFTTGANAGFFREVKTDPTKNSGVIVFWDEFPEPVEAGDEFMLEPGCDRTSTMCAGLYNNLPNFRGRGLFIPGVLAITAGPTSTTSGGLE